MKCGYKGCQCEMSPISPFLNSYPKNYECPHCFTTATVFCGGRIERYDKNGKLYTFEIKE